MKKEKKIVVDKEYLKSLKSILIVLENCDVYEIPVAYILDVYCEATLIGKRKNEYLANDGFIKISAKASKIVECRVLQDKEIGTEWDRRLKERLETCKGGADMTSFALRDKEKRDIDIYVPYDPLEDIMHGAEIELSNCPSFEVDKAGNMIITFGESSKQPRRKDNNYAELVVGWTDTFGANEPKVLRVEMSSLESFGDKKKKFLVDCKICDKFSQKDFLELVFIDCKYVHTEMFFPESGACEIVMSKMADGKIYVGFDGIGIDFICDSVIEYDHYCNRR